MIFFTDNKGASADEPYCSECADSEVATLKS